VTEADFFPIINWDHVELWVGNAKQAAYFYEHGLGFTPVAYAGPETGVRDRASYVLRQGEIRIVVTSGLRSDHEAARFASAHGDGVKDVALEVPSATEAYRQASLSRTGSRTTTAASSSPRSRPTATSSTPSSTARSTAASTSRATSRPATSRAPAPA